ncbi:class II fructose-bisphosphate aldolase [Leifsonia sp. AG29]|uniref:class II fructose-bisphosphate aldolase n=1 Tax=Leifsonia sp. AG29 TaxID=2598860 RepID=UPI00131D5FB6|nr:class II fructose-bisphosphate aldolase [Leifsonia sp. AG29]
MPLVSTADLLHSAASRRTGIGAFDVVQLEIGEALVAAAEETRLPVVLQISQEGVRSHGGLDAIGQALLALAATSSAHVAVHLDRAQDEELVRRAVHLGFGSVMFDSSARSSDERMEATMRVVEFAHADDVAVEAELGGLLGGATPGAGVDPQEARRVVTDTGLDCLAVAGGTVLTGRDPGATAEFDLELIRHLRGAVAVPLSLDGVAGASDEAVVAAIDAGVTKVNLSAGLNRSFTAAVRARLLGDPALVDPEAYLRDGRDAVAAEAATLLRLLDVSGADADRAAVRR